MAVDYEALNGAVKEYISEVRSIMPIDRVFLFGSYAKGSADEDSDVDICFFSNRFEDRNAFDVTVRLLGMTYKYGVDIEPHIFALEDIESGNPFVKEVLRTGVEI